MAPTSEHAQFYFGDLGGKRAVELTTCWAKLLGKERGDRELLKTLRRRGFQGHELDLPDDFEGGGYMPFWGKKSRSRNQYPAAQLSGLLDLLRELDEEVLQKQADVIKYLVEALGGQTLSPISNHDNRSLT